MKAFVVAAAIAFSSNPTAVEPTTALSFPDYESVRNLDTYATPDAYRAAIADQRFLTERITYRSGDLDVFAYVYRPAAASTRMPVIIFNRGSWTWPSFHAELVTMANRLGRAGYVVVAPMYRGSGGAGGRDEMGGSELADLFAVVPAIKALPYADTNDMYLYGESRGGMMVYQALRDGFPARAAAVVGAFTDLDAMLAIPHWAEAGKSIWPDLSMRRREIVERRSAQRWADKIKTPVLIIHGAEDNAVPVSHALDMAHQLTKHGKPYELRVVAGEDHTISGRAADRDAWVVDWFARQKGLQLSSQPASHPR